SHAAERRGSQPDRLSDFHRPRQAAAEGQVREERIGAHHRRAVCQFQRRGGRDQRRPRDPEGDGDDIRPLDAGGAGIRASGESGLRHNRNHMAAKKVTGQVKLQIAAGKATPAPPVGPALGQAQVNIMEFCKQFNAKTSAKELDGLIIPVVITVYSDRSFTFITKTPPASILLKRAAGIAKGSGTPNKAKVGTVTEKQVADIAKQKMPDLNAASVESAIKSIKGTARSMGIDVVA